METVLIFCENPHAWKYGLYVETRASILQGFSFRVGYSEDYWPGVRQMSSGDQGTSQTFKLNLMTTGNTKWWWDV